MARKARLSGIEKFLNNNCFTIFLILFMLIVCYVMGIKNRKVKENFTKEGNRKIRTGFKKMKKNYNGRIERLENKINSGFRNNKRKRQEKLKDVGKAFKGILEKFSFN